MTLSELTCHLLAIVAGTLTHDTLRYALGAGGTYMIVNIALRHVLQKTRPRQDRPGWAQMRREIAISIRTILIFACTGILISVAADTGVFPIYGSIDTYGVVYFWASLVLIILAHDAWFYWTHRMLHLPHLFRRLHRVHHRSHNPTPFTSYSFDAGEAVINAVFLPLFVALVPMHPTALLIFVIHMMLRNALGHCGYEVFPARRDGRPVFGWLTTVTHHDLHHAHGGYNMGLYFTWWDRWMGTEHPDYVSRYAAVAPRVGRPAARLAILAGALALVLVLAPRVQAEDLRGVYATPGLGLVVRMEPCATAPDQRCGRLLWGWEAEAFRHARPGDVILRGLARQADTWRGGRLTDPVTGRTYRGRVTQRVDDRLDVSGCAGPLCRTQIWRPLDQILDPLTQLR